MPSCDAMLLSPITSQDAWTYASARMGVIVGCVKDGEPSVNSEASAVHSAVTPALLTPCQTFVGIVTTREMSRNGLIVPEFVRITEGSKKNGIRNPPFAPVVLSAVRDS
jgi:hypothetical protein